MPLSIAGEPANRASVLVGPSLSASGCERHNVSYIVGIARNASLEDKVSGLLAEAALQVAATQHKVRRFTEFYYQASTWDIAHRVIAKIEVSLQGRNPRYIVTNLCGPPDTLYEKTYCARSDMENQIKQQQLDLYADRTSCHAWQDIKYASKGNLSRIRVLESSRVKT